MSKHSSSKKSKTPWPTKKVMEQIYKDNLWGGGKADFYSGEGSHSPEIFEPYVKVVSEFLQSHSNELFICDLGCGDFNVGQHLVPFSKQYKAVDIVPALIERNKTIYAESNLEFLCLDLAKDELPKGDCLIIRQVLQHLSNDEILAIVKKLYDFKYVILTEHLPEGEFEPNLDKISSLNIRLSQNSGVDLTKAPFSFKPKSQKEVLKVRSEWKGFITTTIFTL